MHSPVRALLIVLLAAMLGGCAVGVTHQYESNAIEIKATEGAKFGIGVQDKRMYVLAKQKPESFVGLSRGGFGNTFDVHTRSGKPLADDFANSIKTALATKRVNVSTVSLPTGIDEQEAIKRVAAAGNKAVLIILKEWKADTMMNTALLYEVETLVVDAKGSVLARKKISGNDNLGGSAINPPEHSRNVVPAAFRKKVEEIFSAPEIAAHL